MKIPFDIKFKPQIESGEYKVVCGGSCYPVFILMWDFKDPEGYCILGYYEDKEGQHAVMYNNSGKLYHDKESMFDLFVVTPEPELSEFEERIFKLLRQYKEFDIPLTPENIKAEASMLWPDFEKYFFDLYGKEGEGDSALRSFYYRGLADGKAEALKDLPKWRKDKSFETEGTFMGVNGREYFVVKDGYSISVAELIKKLPGFKED